MYQEPHLIHEATEYIIRIDVARIIFREASTQSRSASIRILGHWEDNTAGSLRLRCIRATRKSLVGCSFIFTARCVDVRNMRTKLMSHPIADNGPPSQGLGRTSSGRLSSTRRVVSSGRVPKMSISLPLPFLPRDSAEAIPCSVEPSVPFAPDYNSITLCLGSSPRASSVGLACLAAIRMDTWLSPRASV
jgi:hypothetical protein